MSVLWCWAPYWVSQGLCALPCKTGLTEVVTHKPSCKLTWVNTYKAHGRISSIQWHWFAIILNSFSFLILLEHHLHIHQLLVYSLMNSGNYVQWHNHQHNQECSDYLEKLHLVGCLLVLCQAVRDLTFLERGVMKVQQVPCWTALLAHGFWASGGVCVCVSVCFIGSFFIAE